MAVLFVRFDIPKAIVVSLLFGYLFLPEQINFDLPVLPTLQKHTIPAMAALLFVLIMDKARSDKVLSGWLPKGGLPRFLFLLLIASSMITVFTNSDPLFYGPLFLPALRPYDGMAIILTLLVSLIPFLLARKYLAHPDQQRMLLAVIVFAGFIYSFLALFEVRMSPQLNSMIYGFFPHSFLQHIRGDGFRPLVFLNHGLWLAIFFAGTILAAFSLARIPGSDQRAKFLLLGFWLLLTLALSNSLGALAIAMLLVPVALFLGTRVQLLVCAAIAMTVLAYPALRGAGWVPTEVVLGWAEAIDPDRAGSLAFRLRNEDLLLAKAQERPLFGWGGFGRNMVFDEFGQELTVVDGYWIIIVGQGGWMRYLAEFGLCCLPMIIAALNAQRIGLGFETTGLTLMLTANMLDLIPNATITPLTWLVVGAIWGRVELGKICEDAQDLAPQAKTRRGLAYTRFGHPHPNARANNRLKTTSRHVRSR